MPIEHRRVGDICDNCGDRLPESKNVSTYPENEPLLCQKCGDKLIKEKNQECSVCKKPVGVQNLSEYRNKLMCNLCVEAVKRNEVTTKERKRFFKTNWFKWIMIGFGIITIVIGYIGLT